MSDYMEGEDRKSSTLKPSDFELAGRVGTIPKTHVGAFDSRDKAQKWLDTFDVLEHESICISGTEHGVWMTAYGTREVNDE